MIGEIVNICILENFTMQSVGTYLKSSREAKNISLSDISHHTKISKWYLNCLEKDDFANLPGDPYTKGYISSYAMCIGIDQNEAIDKYNSSNSENKLTIQADTNVAKKTYSRFPAYLSKKVSIIGFGIIIMILLLAGFHHFIFQGSGDAKLQKSYRNQEQNEFQTSKTQIAEPPSKGSVLKKANLAIQKTASSINLESLTNTLPEPMINQSATEEISKSPEPLAASKTETLALNADSVRQKEQIQSNAENKIKVVEVVAGGGLQNKYPIDTGNSFQWSIGRVYIWSLIECPNPPASIKHIYYFNKQKVSEVLLDVKSHQWRTWSYKTLSDERYIGQWRVDITSAAGKMLKSIRFEVK